MTQEQLRTLFAMLEGYWPGDWTEARYALWADAFVGLTFERARDLIVELGRTEDYPTISKYLRLINPAHDGVIADGDRRFSPGIGWLGEPTSEQPALESGEPSAVIDFDTARRDIEAARHRKRERDNPGA